MQLKKIGIKNFRLLHDVELLLEKQTTVIVGRNNSGKTSLTEVVSRVLAEGNSTFKLEDFSCAAHQCFWDAFLAKVEGKEPATVRTALPTIDVIFSFEYEKDTTVYGTLADFILDLDLDCIDAKVVVSYQIEEGRLDALFDDLTSVEPETKPDFFRTIRPRIPNLYTTIIHAVDPNDASNIRPLNKAALRAACANNCINAQRGLDDESQKERVVIGKVLENLFATAKGDEGDETAHTLAKDLEQAVEDIQTKVGSDFNVKLDELLPALTIFGYPGLNDGTTLRTETTFDVERLLTNHTKVRYEGANGIHLPESYNGLGIRNIILILLQLREHFKLYCAIDPKPVVHLVFIEEPEVHLHPQMQEVFIRKLGEIAAQFSKETSVPWPVQFVVSTHSSHIANEAHFETIRYFLTIPQNDKGDFKTVIKDLRSGLAGKQEPDRGFLHQYMTLTRCDLFFADKAILIEGTGERLLLPKMIRVLDMTQAEDQRLGSQYVSIVEVGGAYTHLFFDLLDFLELKTLVITDIDTVKQVDRKGKKVWVSSPVHEGTRSSNACINTWFADPKDKDARLSPSQLLGASDLQKLNGHRRIAYQLPEQADGPCGRTFEDAFMLANAALCGVAGKSKEELENDAYAKVEDIKKSEFALDHALRNETWSLPRYIREGLIWLAQRDKPKQPALATDLEVPHD